jgi:hypothetical protein
MNRSLGASSYVDLLYQMAPLFGTDLYPEVVWSFWKSQNVCLSRLLARMVASGAFTETAAFGFGAAVSLW